MTETTRRLQVGEPAPAFTLPDDTGAEVSLSDFAGQRVVVYFYPAAMTRDAPRRACDFSDSLDSLRAAGYEVLAISPDQPEKLAKFRAKQGLGIRLLSDGDRAVMTSYAAFGEKKTYGKTVRGVIRSTFVVGEDGTLEQAQYNVRATGHVAKLKRDLALAD